MKTHRRARLIAWGGIYFAIVFAVGFVLGIVRVVWLEPKLGTRWAELLEIPLMIVAIVFAARWIVISTKERFGREGVLAVGLIGLAILLTAEGVLVVLLRGMSISEYIASRDPVSGSAYLVSLFLFAIMPRILRNCLNTGSSNPNIAKDL